MLLLLIYILIALGFSFYCSIAEAVLLSVSRPYISLLEKEESEKGRLLRHLKDDINRPLAAILSLNTIAHTMGAAGAGAQAALVFGSAYIGVISAVLTLLILVFSEIIPKTLGAHYWRQLAVPVARSLQVLIWLLLPFVILSEKLTSVLKRGEEVKVTRDEMAAMAELGEDEGQLGEHESQILKNLFLLRETTVRDIMTPRSVVFSVPDSITVAEYFEQYNDIHFSRIPTYSDFSDHVDTFVLRSDLLLAHGHGKSDTPLSHFRRDLKLLADQTSVLDAYTILLEARDHISLVVDEHGAMQGIATLEDIIETLLGLEIVDESDRHTDMQQLAKMLWKKREERMAHRN